MRPRNLGTFRHRTVSEYHHQSLVVIEQKISLSGSGRRGRRCAGACLWFFSGSLGRWVVEMRGGVRRVWRLGDEVDYGG